MKNVVLKVQRYNVTQMKRTCYGEKELELDLEKELEQEETLDYTTLDLIFNYINKYNISNQLDFSQTEEQQKENARMYLVKNTLNKLGIYVSDEKTLEMMTEDRRKDILIQYYVIDEFSKSPYNFLLYKLNTENFNFRYKKAMKYVDKEELTRFISYLIACLQEELIN